MEKKFRILGTEDAITTCDCCGKANLKATFAVEILSTGEILHYGSVCVTRNTGIKNPTKAANDYEAERMKAATLELHESKEYQAERVRFEQRNAMKLETLKEKIDFVKDYVAAVDRKRMELKEKYNLRNNVY